MSQYFFEENIKPVFPSQTPPQLYYMGKILPEISSYPRIMHAHEKHVEISIIYSGTSKYMIGDKKQLIQPGDILIYNSKIMHDEISGIDMQIGSYFLAVGNIHMPNLRPNALFEDDINPVFHIPKDFDNLKKICEDMLTQLEQPSEWSKYMVYYNMRAILEIVWQTIRTVRLTQQQEPTYPIAKTIKEYIDVHYREPLNMKTICSELNISESYAAHVFKEALGYSLMQYVLRCKIGEAQTLLISTDYSIATIAQMVGFDASSHFNQRFIKYVGLSPSKFRKNYRKKKSE